MTQLERDLASSVGEPITETPEPRPDKFLRLPNGAHQNVPHATYHERHLGIVSQTALKLVNRSPAHYKAWVDGTAENEDSPALAFGRAFHCALLEPDVFHESYAVAPDFGDCRNAGNKNRRDKWREEHAGKEHLAADDGRTIIGMVASILSHPLAGKMIRNGVPEMTLKWSDPETKLTCRSRLDYYVERHAMILDAKSTLDARERPFMKQILDYNYHVQDALYRSAAVELQLPIQHFVFVAVEKFPPYAVATHTLGAEGIGKGYSAARRDIETLAECMRTNTWPGYPVGITTLDLPPWAA